METYYVLYHYLEDSYLTEDGLLTKYLQDAYTFTNKAEASLYKRNNGLWLFNLRKITIY